MFPRSLVHSHYPALAGHVAHAAAKVQVSLWDRAVRNVESVQLSLLQKLVSQHAQTVFGREHKFSLVRDHESFAANVPIGGYDEFSPYIERMRQGERDVLVAGFVEHFGNSSGSSDQRRSKFLPITEAQILQQQRAGADVLARYLVWAKETEMTRGFTIQLFPPITQRREGPVWVTSNPALMTARSPLIAKPMLLPEADVLAIAEYDEKLCVIAERYFDHDIRAVTGTTCWFPVLFEKVLAVAKQRGLDATTIRQIWPNLRLLIGGGVSADPYRPLIRRQVGQDVTLVDTYNATEGGIYASSDFTSEPGLLVMPHRGVFFEFVPMDDIESPSPRRVPLWRVERNRPYAIVVTTSAGMYAYRLGDIVRFPSVSPLHIEYMGRLSGCLSVTQELTTHVEVQDAVAEAVRQVPCTTIEFAVGPEFGVGATGKSRYVLLVEFSEQQLPADADAFVKAFDASLCQQNRVYREHRKDDVGILAPRLVVLPSGATRRFMEDVTRGNVQGKFPRILDEQRTKVLSSTTGASPQSSPSPLPA